MNNNNNIFEAIYELSYLIININLEYTGLLTSSESTSTEL